MENIESLILINNRDEEKTTLDNDVFVNMYESYYKKVYNYICYRVSNHSEAEELVSSVFEKIIMKYHTYRPNHSPLEAWIIGIAKNVVADYYRATKKHIFLPLDAIMGFVSHKNQPEEEALISESNAALLKALDALKGKEREILSMKFATDLKNCEIALVMGISESNVSTITHRAIKKLRKELERMAWQ